MYDPGIGLMMQPMPTPIYPAVQTQRTLPHAVHSAPPLRQPEQCWAGFGAGGWDARSPSWGPRDWDSKGAIHQDLYAAAPTQRLDEDEECLDADLCGAEDRPPKPENLVCGIDTRPLLPIGLAASTVVGALVMLLLQIPLLSRFASVSESHASAGFLALCAVTLGCMTYCAFADPGQMDRESGSAGSPGSPGSDNAALPHRAHQSWQYKRPIRRYDHYCRWLSNCIGLLNHREFLVMLVGLLAIGLIGAGVDLTLMAPVVDKAWWQTLLMIGLHLGYSIGLIWLAFPILRIHVGLVSRNELAAEWTRHDFYIAQSSKRGKDVSVKELSDDEFNALFDEFVYDKTKNSFDHGCMSNCFRFWCLPRWNSAELGEF